MKTLRECLTWAEKKNVAIGHFNISDSEGFKAVVESAKKLSLPVIIGVSEGERDFIGLEEINALVETAREDGLPVFLNADHTYSIERVREALEAGVDSLIIDAADKTYADNVAITKEAVSLAKEHSLKAGREILVEGELGFIGKSSKLLDKLPDGISEATQTKPEEAGEFVLETGVDLLAPSVGNVHGRVKSGNPKINIERIKALRESVKVPLVLHGGSGIKDEDFRGAIKAGIRIVHINTELRAAYKSGLEEGLRLNELAPYKFIAPGVAMMEKVVTEKLKLFNNL